MPTHIALLRGINVGGRNRLAMADLRRVAASLGHTEVATYIQSGNLVFTPAGSAGGTEAALAAELEYAIATELGVSPRVIVRTREELAQVVRDNPYPDEPNPKAVHAVFLEGKIGPEVTAAVEQAQQKAAAKGSRDTATLVGRTLYLHTPDGFGRSELAAALAGQAELGEVTGTARNWATVNKLLAMCG
ncbi:MAG TPA: DUF1697 domain-containing protein [Natronosporangium sp.]